MKCSHFILPFLAFCTNLAAADDKAKPDASKLPPAAKRVVDFERDVQPLLAKTCLACHGAEKQRAGLRLDDGAEALKGGNSGPVLKPGDAAGSRLLFLVAGLDAETQMPPEGKKPLTAEEVGVLRAWVEQGAKWPKSAAASAARAKTDHWAFLPPRRHALPAVADASRPRNGIDYFILSRLEKEKIAPSAAADKSTLIRRLSLDLLGLPPTPADVDRFVHDARPDAYERLVNRLLDSPHYGERWARHWLDLARYADSDGYEKDTGRPNAWRWRDWVIGTLNRDLPFDQFTIEQLAGDLLPNATVEQQVATGFHRNTLTNREGGVDQEQFRVEAVVDRVGTTAKAFLGITLGCAQCHDHKYDPFSQREFYQFFAYFNSDVERDLPVPGVGDEKAAYEKQKAAFDKKRAELQRALDAHKQELTAKDVTDAAAKKDTKLAELTKSLTAHDRQAPRPPVAQTLALGAPRQTQVMIRGDFLRPGVEVQPGTPGVLPPLAAPDAHGLQPVGVPGPTRLELAKWIVGPDNPLTARVIANWVWHKYFGRGIVPTLEDFGTQGAKPSHPELLDWLATEFIRQGWSLKALHKLIVTSTTYRQSAQARPELIGRDPLNVLLARQNRMRLEAELLRDNALAASGLLTPAVGGPSVRPPQPAGISELSYANSVKWVESTGADRYRRGLYTWFQRTSPYPMLMTFDAPDANLSCVRRERSNTPLQALTLLNDATFVECSQALGRRVLAEKSGPTAGRLRHAVRLCLAREPSSVELDVLGRLFAELHAASKADPNAAAKLVGATKPAGADTAEAAAWVALARTLLNLDEFVTRE